MDESRPFSHITEEAGKILPEGGMNPQKRHKMQQKSRKEWR